MSAESQSDGRGDAAHAGGAAFAGRLGAGHRRRPAPLPGAADRSARRAKADDGARAGGAAIDRTMESFQEIIFKLKQYWAERGCIIQEPYDVEVGAGTMCPETFLRVLGPEALSRRLRAAQPPPRRRPLRRKSQSPLQAPAAAGDPEAVARRRDRSIPGQPGGHRHRPAQARHQVRRRQLGSRPRWAPGASAGR